VLDGSCRTPIAGYAIHDREDLWLRGLVVAPDGSQAFAGERHGAANDAAAMGADLGRELLALGGSILGALR
jgi:hydroxymethylbilane synthase